jgi:uncharacterized protein (DUF983 family)
MIMAQSLLRSVLACKCPQCREGNMFIHKTYGKGFMKMPVYCTVCQLKFEKETGFWWGTGYVSYALTVAVSMATFVAWYILIGMSVQDNRPFYWLAFNSLLLLVLLPYLMRLSRTLWLTFFVSYKPLG